MRPPLSARQAPIPPAIHSLLHRVVNDARLRALGSPNILYTSPAHRSGAVAVARHLIYLVLDGVADSLRDQRTTLEASRKLGLDRIAAEGACGAMYTIGRGVAPESDSAVIALLGYDPEKVYTGRGPLEALGAGLSIREGYEVAFRANFATIDPGTRRIIDRRVGRTLSTEEARRLAEALVGMDLGLYDGYARVKAAVGHRAVVIIGSRSHRLSPAVENSDPAYVRRGLISVAAPRAEPYVRRVEPLEPSEEARITAELANAFTEKAIRILEEHPVNRERRARGLLPANAILLRDAGGSLPRAEPLGRRYGVRFALVAEMPVELGIGRAFGADVHQVPPPSGDPEEDYGLRLEKTLELLRSYDVVYVHLKGPDEPGHDGDFERKKRSVEDIDRFFVLPLLDRLPSDTAILVTADHATPPSARTHTDDPVPVALWGPGVEPDGVCR
ncbi:MAG: hypothetical protein DRO39_05295, partial [Thermoprotei archaeon]